MHTKQNRDGGFLNVTMLLPVLLVEPDRLSRLGVETLLIAGGLSVVSVATGGEAISSVSDNRFSLVVSETLLPDVAFPELVRRIRRVQPLKVAVITGETDRNVLSDALTVGPCAVLSKYSDPDQLAPRLVMAARGGLLLDDITYQALESVLADGRTPMLPRLAYRELQVLDRIAAGFPLNIVARQLQLAESTVKTHAARAATRLNVNSSKEAADIALRHGMFDTLDVRVSVDPFHVAAVEADAAQADTA